MDKKYLLRENASFEYQKDDEDLLAALNDKSRPLILTGVIQRYDTLNKNGRVYSKDILMQEVRNYDEMFVKTDSAWGELDHCLTEEHQIHTTSGWKYLKDIAEDEEIYTLNTKTGIIEKETILRKIAKPYTGEMYRFYANKHKDLLNCTPNHKMIFWNRYGKYKEMFAKEVYEKLEAGSRELGKSRMKIGGTWIGESPDTFTIPNTSFTMPSKVWMALFGIWIAEGFATGSKGGKTREHAVVITQKKEKTVDEIRELLAQTNMVWKEKTRKDGLTKDFSIRNKSVWNYFKQFGNSSEKYIPKEFLNWDKELIDVLFTWMLKGDGRNRRGWKNKLIREYSTVSNSLVANVEEIFFKLGISSRKNTRIQVGDATICGRTIPEKNCKPLHTIAQNKTNIFLSFDTVKREKYFVENKMVYCVTTKNGNFLTRNGEQGRVHWTGNSDSPIVTAKTTCHLIKKIWTEGNAVYAKIQILDNPNGDIVRSMIKAGGRPGISSRAVGSLEKRHFGNSGVVDFVKDDLQIICWDIVTEPSTPGAYMTLSEARELRDEEIKLLNEHYGRPNRARKENKISNIIDEITSLRKNK